MPRRYAFTTRWELDAGADRIWDALVEAERWPAWWPSVRSVVAVAPGDARGIGAVNRFTWRGRLPYALTFDMRVTEVETHRRLAGEATGELVGTGVWTLAPNGRTTHVRYDWTVATTKAWMNAVAPLLEPAFRWNHDDVMRRGGEGLARLLGARLVTSSSPAARRA